MTDSTHEARGPERIWHSIDRRGKIESCSDAHVQPCDDVASAYVEYCRADLPPTDADYAALQARLAEAEKERDEADDLAKAAFADGASNNIRLAEAAHRIKLLEARAEAAEACVAVMEATIKEAALSRLAHLSQAADAKARAEAAEALLPEAVKAGVLAAAERIVAKGVANPQSRGQYANALYSIHALAGDPETISRIVAQLKEDRG